MQYAIGILLLLLGSLGYLYREELQSHEATKTELTQSKATVTALQKALSDMGTQQAEISDKNLKATLELREVKRKLDTYKNREAVLINKPEMVAKLINKDFKKDEEELACLTGDTALCP